MADVDAAFKRAVDAGAQPLATRTKELSKEEIERAGREWMAQMAQQK